MYMRVEQYRPACVDGWVGGNTALYSSSCSFEFPAHLSQIIIPFVYFWGGVTLRICCSLGCRDLLMWPSQCFRLFWCCCILPLKPRDLEKLVG